MAESVVYSAEVTTPSINKLYLGSASTTWKDRYSTHLTSFHLWKYEKTCSLAGYIWKLKDQNISYNIKWKILKVVNSYKKESKRCMLCLTEKTMILHADKSLLINKRRELFNKCLHRKKHKLKAFL